ncbi:PqqD family protein [Thiohalocapsa marina]|uniref:PqqD family protein n=1 Tax=Thiohalocapsa marina TaxID=424902 RepID=A0A5M8FUD7_9GAMM|nr:PqqD family protein [Thiohalocapsa marina]KAA6187412.1 PqqD family protein [Thiohalocapsa marina]
MKIQISSQILTQTIDDELVVLNIETGRYFGLQASGSRVWRLLEELGDTEAVIDGLLKTYEVDEVTLRRDVDELLTNLIEAQLVTAVPEAHD